MQKFQFSSSKSSFQQMSALEVALPPFLKSPLQKKSPPRAFHIYEESIRGEKSVKMKSKVKFGNLNAK